MVSLSRVLRFRAGVVVPEGQQRSVPVPPAAGQVAVFQPVMDGMEQVGPLPAPKGVGRVVAPDGLRFLASLLPGVPVRRVKLVRRVLFAPPVPWVLLAGRPPVPPLPPFRLPILHFVLEGLPVATVARRLLVVGARLRVKGAVWPPPRPVVLLAPLLVPLLARVDRA